MSRKIRDAFDSVKAYEQMKEKTKETLIAQLDSCSKRRFYQRPVFYRTLAGALLLVLVFAGSMRAYAVSYTHLFGAGRQKIMQMLSGNLQQNITDRAIGTGHMESVSYTHLDVYKRQTVHCFSDCSSPCRSDF